MMPANESKLMDCDILVASPLGMKMMSEKEGSTDLLSSVEVVAVDGADVMLMQNWEHVQVSTLQRDKDRVVEKTRRIHILKHI